MARAPWELTPEMFLDADEAAELLAHLRRRESAAPAADQTSRTVDRLIVETLMLSGLRCSEFCATQLRDASLAAPEPALHVRGKRGAGRTVVIPRRLAAHLASYIRQIRPALLADEFDPRDPAGPLIVNERGRPYDRTALYRRVVATLADCGLGDRASVQFLRHTYGYLAYLRSGGNLLFVQRQLGHAHPMITSIYAQFVNESYAALADRVAAEITADRETPATQPTRPRRQPGKVR